MTQSLRRLAAGVLSLAVLGVTTATATTSATAAEPDTGAPAVGTCYDLKAADVAKESLARPAVDCKADHTAIVISTVQVGSDYSDMAKIDDKISKGCYAKLTGILGGTATTRAQSVYYWAWFAPTNAEREAGAEWATCLVFQDNGKTLRDLPAKKPLISGKLKAAQKRCISTKSGYVVPCSTKHDYRSVEPFKMAKFPTEKQAGKLAAKQCPKRTSGDTYYYTYPAKDAFAAGWKMMVCYEKSSKA